MTYSEKLKDPRWQRRRLEILELSSWSCNECGDSTTELHVHHWLYKKGKSPWDYEDFELAALCKECHQKAEEDRVRLLSVIARCYPCSPMGEIADALEYLLRNDWQTVWNWINAAKYPDLLETASIRRREEVVAIGGGF